MKFIESTKDNQKRAEKKSFRWQSRWKKMYRNINILKDSKNGTTNSINPQGTRQDASAKSLNKHLNWSVNNVINMEIFGRNS